MIERVDRGARRAIESGRRQFLLGAGGTLAALALAACSSGTGTGTTGPSTPAGAPANSPTSAPAGGGSGAGGQTVVIKNFAFSPSSLTVPPGTKITVVNQDAPAHTLTATGTKAFDTGTLDTGKSAVITAPAQPGDYPYICTIHPFMKGNLTVK